MMRNPLARGLPRNYRALPVLSPRQILPEQYLAAGWLQPDGLELMLKGGQMGSPDCSSACYGAIRHDKAQLGQPRRPALHRRDWSGGDGSIFSQQEKVAMAT